MVYNFNRPALACYRRAGFSVEGVLRRVKKVGDQYWNLAIMSVLREEWEENLEIRAHAWLRPDQGADLQIVSSNLIFC